ncbi:MAG TPA: hydrogenase, partial [Marinobacter sp.]
MAHNDRQPLIPPSLTHTAVSDRISGIVLDQPSPGPWKLAFVVSAALALVLLVSLVAVFTT